MIRNLLKRTPFYAPFKRLGHYPDFLYWKLRGEPVRSPHLLKQRIVKEYARRFGLRTLVETGTYYGEMVSATKDVFQRIYSIELDEGLYRRAHREFARYPHIQILHGDSRTLLPQILRSIDEPCLFWLDAGYYGWADFQTDSGRLGAELEAIFRHPVQDHVILMDDARGLSGRNGAPTVEELTTRVRSAYQGRHVEVRHDVLRIYKPG